MEFVGRRVRKEFLGVYTGIVKSYNSESGLFEIKYEDGDSEEIEFSRLALILEEQSAADAEFIDRIGQKRKKRRRAAAIRGGSGNDSPNLAGVSSVGASGKTLREDFGVVNAKNFVEHGVDLNLVGGSNVNDGLDLNVPFADSENLEVFNRGSLRSGGLIDLNVYVSEDDDGESKLAGGNMDIPKKEHCFDLNFGVNDDLKDLNADDDSVKGFNGCTENLGVIVPPNDVGGDSNGTMKGIANFGVLDTNCVNESGSSENLVMGPSNASTMEAKAYEGNVGRTDKGNCRKRRRISESVDSATKTVLRRSARTGRTTISVQENVPGAICLDAVKDVGLSPAVSAVLEEKHSVLGCEESEERNILPPKPQLPPSSENLNLDGIPIFDLFSVYSFLRSFSTVLFLSPFKLGDFVASLRCKVPSLLFDYIHFSLLQTLRKHLESLSDESSESASVCLRSLNWNYLDLVTWPIFMVEYLLMHSSPSSLGFDLCRLKLFKSDYYMQPVSVKIDMLRCLCDDVNEVEIIRSEINIRTLATDPSMEFDRKMVLETPRKGKAAIDVSGTSCLTSEVVNETTDWNSDECCLCKMDGNLICCDGCPAAFHSRCVGVACNLLPEGDWYCPECIIDKDNPWMRVGKSIRGAELLGIDPYGRQYYNSCGFLLVSDSGDMESPFRYYHRNDLTDVIEVIKSSHVFYSTLPRAIRKFWNVSAKLKNDMGSQIVTVSIDYTRKGDSPAMPLQPLLSAPLETIQDEIPVKRRTEEKSRISTCSGNVECEVSEPVAVDKSMKMDNPIPSSEGSAEISQAITGIHNLQNTRTSERSSEISNDSKIPEKPVCDEDCPLSSNNLEIEVGKNIQLADYGSIPFNVRENIPQSQRGTNYVNFYSFARTASSAAEVLLHKSSDKILEDSRRSVEEMISAQLKVFSNISTEFCWSNIRNIDVDARKERCGWCISCKVPEDGGDCLFIIKDTGSFLKNFTSELLGIHPKKSWIGHLVDVMCHILSIEDRLHGLLLGPWLNPHYSKIWRKAVYKASDVRTLKHFLIMIESNLHTRALSAEWHRQVDNATKVGSATHIVTRSHRVSSKHGVSRKRSRCPDSEQNPSSNAATGLGLFWWRGGRISRELFKWKVLPRSLASKAARQAGSKKIPGIVYSEGSEFAKRSKCVTWRASVEASSSVDQLALQVRELDANIKWDAIENIQFLSKMDKEFRKSVRSFKKVIIRRKCLEGTVGKYLLDFGKRRFIPDIVVKHGSMLEESSSVRKKYWLEECYVPLHLFKAFEEKRIARKINKTSSVKLQESGSVFKKFSKKGFSYLFTKAERAEYYQCGHCKKDVLIREAVSCQYCEGFFHKRHVRKSAEAITAECTYTCHKCRDWTCVKIDATKGKPTLQKGKKTSKVKRSVRSKISTPAGKDEQIKQSQSNKKVSVAVPLRRSERKVKLMSRQTEISGGLKKGKQTIYKKRKSKKPNKSKNQMKTKNSKKPKNSEQAPWQKKRTFVSYPYWLNGLRLCKKPNEETLMQFRSENLFVASEELNVILDKPKCSLCCEAEFSSALNYIGCEICGDWFHGDAFELGAEKVGYLIGFKCHKCRNKAPPVCPQMDAIRIDESKLGRSSTAGVGYNQEVSNSLALSIEHTGNGTGFSQTLAQDTNAEHVPVSLEQRGQEIHDFKEKKWRPPDILINSNENILLEDISLEMGEGSFVKVTTPLEMESSLFKPNVDLSGKELTSLGSKYVKNGSAEMTAMLGSVVIQNPVDSSGLPPHAIADSAIGGMRIVFGPGSFLGE